VPLGQLAKTRYHGDLHMGQVLVAQDDFIIVDFEGEPGRSLEERRAKTCVMRDVAGMVRSFGYAHAAATRREAPPTEGRDTLLGDWERDAVHCFLQGYREATHGVSSVPGDDAAFRALLDFFVLEKALYELRYEVANRPDWVDIPLRGLMEVARA
jgi:maltose alpha-D-glucosyltransferase/alpha-amylase